LERLVDETFGPPDLPTLQRKTYSTTIADGSLSDKNNKDNAKGEAEDLRASKRLVNEGAQAPSCSEPDLNDLRTTPLSMARSRG